MIHIYMYKQYSCSILLNVFVICFVLYETRYYQQMFFFWYYKPSIIDPFKHNFPHSIKQSKAFQTSVSINILAVLCVCGCVLYTFQFTQIHQTNRQFFWGKRFSTIIYKHNDTYDLSKWLN